jgi:hypothetical protein
MQAAAKAEAVRKSVGRKGESPCEFKSHRPHQLSGSPVAGWRDAGNGRRAYFSRTCGYGPAAVAARGAPATCKAEYAQAALPMKFETW